MGWSILVGVSEYLYMTGRFQWRSFKVSFGDYINLGSAGLVRSKPPSRRVCPLSVLRAARRNISWRRSRYIRPMTDIDLSPTCLIRPFHICDFSPLYHTKDYLRPPRRRMRTSTVEYHNHFRLRIFLVPYRARWHRTWTQAKVDVRHVCTVV